MADNSFDVLIIGSGPGGYVTAIRAAQLGFKTAIVEREHLGGICLNWGCIPTKALLRTSEIYHYMKHAKDYGLSADNVSFDPAAVVQRSRGVAGRLNSGVTGLLRKNKVQVIWGEAKITKPGEVVVSEIRQARHAAANPRAQGHDWRRHLSRPSTSSSPPAQGRARCPASKPMANWCGAISKPWCRPKCRSRCWSSAPAPSALSSPSFYNAMGVDVTVVEIMDQVMPVEDAEIAKIAQKQLEKLGLKIKLGAKVSALKKAANSVTATIEQGATKSELTVDRVISAVGVVGNIENLGLEALGVKTEKGCIVIDGFGRTNVAGVYAIGDVAGPPMLAHKAEHEGVICIEKIKGLDAHPMKKEQIPGLHLLPPAGGLRRPHRSQGQGRGLRTQGRPLSLHRQRQGHRPWRGSGFG